MMAKEIDKRLIVVEKELKAQRTWNADQAQWNANPITKSPIHKQIQSAELGQSTHNTILTIQILQCQQNPKNLELPKIQGSQPTITKSVKPQQCKSIQPPTQLMLRDIPGFQQTIEAITLSSWGHEPETIDADATFRVLFNNPNGIKLQSDPLSVQYSFSILSTMGLGAICLAETNVNWSNSQIYQTCKDLSKKIWHHSTFTTSHAKEYYPDVPTVYKDSFKGSKKPGGTLTMLCNNWTSRVLGRGSDPYGLGHWTYFTLRGKANTKIVLVTAYRVCTQSISTAGPTTSTAQQSRVLSKKIREADPNPRHQFIVDL